MTNDTSSSGQAGVDFWESEAQRLIDVVGAGFLRKASFEEVLEKAGPTFSHASSNQMRSVVAVATRQLKSREVAMWNRHAQVGARVYYLLSPIEGKVMLRTASPAYLIGELAVVDLEHIGTVLLEKVEAFAFEDIRPQLQATRPSFLGIPIWFGGSAERMSTRTALHYAVIWGIAGVFSGLLGLRDGNMILVTLGTAALIPMFAFLWAAWQSPTNARANQAGSNGEKS